MGCRVAVIAAAEKNVLMKNKLNKIVLYLTSMLAVVSFAQADQSDNENIFHGKKALIFGVFGQDGIYLTELLLSKNYQVHGVKRGTSLPSDTFIGRNYQEAHFANNRFFVHEGDLLDFNMIKNIIEKVQPDEIYNLAAQSQVRVSFEIPLHTAEVDALGTLRILEAVRDLGLVEKVKFYQASTSELFGLVQESPQTEKTPFCPRSPYAISKLFAYWTTVNYRECYKLFACNGILFNHESPLRGESFVTRKITLAACRHKLGLQEILYLGNLDVKRDWGYAKDYVEAMWLMLQQDKPDDYVIATGEMHSIRELVEFAFKELDIKIQWQGQGASECGINAETGKTIIKVDPKFYRPTEVDLTVGNAEKAQKILNWKSKTSFQELIHIMIEADYQKVLNERGLAF